VAKIIITAEIALRHDAKSSQACKKSSSCFKEDGTNPGTEVRKKKFAGNRECRTLLNWA